jgi:transposase
MCLSNDASTDDSLVDFRRAAHRMTRSKPEIVEVDTDQLEALLHRAEQQAFQDEDYRIIGDVLQSYVYVTGLLRDKRTAIDRLRKLLFGASTEKTVAVIGDPAAPLSPDADSATLNVEKTASAVDVAPRKGHGRNAADAYRGGEWIDVPHASLQAGDACPDCRQGTVYELGSPGVLVRIVGQAPLHARIYQLQKLRCQLCGQVFTAEPPPAVGTEKYDATAASMIALLKYGSGLPFNRLEGLQDNVAIPLPASTQWDVIQASAPTVAAVHEELIRQAAQGDVVHNDDTTVKILELMGARAKQRALAEQATDHDAEDKTQQQPAQPPTSRSGLFTSGVVATREGRRVALFFSGHQHAGENLADVLRHRSEELQRPIQMCDALSRNLIGDLKTIVANCLAHARRQFVDVYDRFPDECRCVLEALKVVYGNDAEARKQRLSPEQRLQFHQTHSQPAMDRLHCWLNRQFDEKLVEPNSALGGAIRYMLKHWEKLTLFLRAPGAPLDNNLCERALKKAILHRKNSLFYKTPNGARVGDMYMSLIHTCELCGVSAFDYLTELHRHVDALAAHPEQWLPWNYREMLTT